MRRRVDDDVAVAQACCFLGDLVFVGAAGDDPVPLLEQGERDDLGARARLARLGVLPRVGDQTILLFQDLLDEFAAVGIAAGQDVLAFLGRVHHQVAQVLARRGVQHVVVAGLADLHFLDAFLQHGDVGVDVQADVQDADDLAGGIADRFVVGDVLFAEQLGQADIGLAGADRRIGRAAAVQHRSHRAFAVFLLHRGADAHEVLAARHEDGGVAARLAREAVGDREVEVQRAAAFAQRGHRLVADGDHGALVEREAAVEVGGEDAAEAAGLSRHRLVEQLDRIDHAVEFRLHAGDGAVVQHVGRGPADHEDQAGEDRAEKTEREAGDLGPDGPVLDTERSVSHGGNDKFGKAPWYVKCPRGNKKMPRFDASIQQKVIEQYRLVN